MLVGVAAFSTGTSAITNLLTNYDQENQKLNKNLDILNKIKNQYSLPLDVYEDVKRSIKFQFKNDIEEESSFVQELPQDLKVTVSLFLYENLFKSIDFLYDRPMVFIAWICPRLKPMVQNEGQYIYKDDDEVSCIYFMIDGEAGYVLP
jgi:hypothetical protein